MRKNKHAGIMLLVVMVAAMIEFVFEVIHHNSPSHALVISLFSGVMAWVYLPRKEDGIKK